MQARAEAAGDPTEVKRRGEGTAPDDADSENHAKQLAKWTDIVMLMGEHSKFYRDLRPDETVAKALGILFAEKPAGTLAKRASSMNLYIKWAMDCKTDAFPLTENTAYDYVRDLVTKGAPASTANVFRATVSFVGGFLGADNAETIRASRRMLGTGAKAQATQRDDVEVDPLPVRAVAVLEQAAAGRVDGISDADRIIAGFAAFALHCRVRVGDCAKVKVEPILDLAAGGSGFVEVRTKEHKTAARGAKKKLPLVGLARGVSDTAWAEGWLAVRRASGLDAAADRCLQRVPGTTGWKKTRMTTNIFNAWLATFWGKALKEGPGGGLRLTSRSMKVTLLAWGARYGIPAAERRMLGYHVEHKDRSMMAYSRDEVAAPLRKIAAMLADVRRGAFDPDVTRSGFWADEKDGSTDDSTSSDSSGCGGAEGESPSEGPVVEVKEDRGPAPPDGMVLNTKTSYLHKEGDGSKVKCGKPVPKYAEFVAGWPTCEFQECTKCFRK